MALLETPEPQENFQAPNFKLKNIDGAMLGWDDVKGEKGTVVAFICNHCPYVKAIIDRFVEDAKTLQAKGIGVVAIMPNDTEKYPADSFDNMKIFANENGFTFPYLIDTSQNIAKEYGAVCTPDIYGFNAEDTLEYRGRVDSAGPNEASDDTVKELVNAMSEIAQSGSCSVKQFPSMGCSIKWK